MVPDSRQHKHNLALLCLGAAGFAITLGTHPVSFGLYLFYVCTFLGFSGKDNSVCALISATFCSIAVYYMLGDSIPLTGPAIVVLCVYSGFEVIFPFVLHHKLLELPVLDSLSHAKKSLLFPILVTATEYFHAKTFPYGSYGISAYTQFGSPSLMQLVSLFGIWSLSFFSSWVGGAVAQIILLNENSRQALSHTKLGVAQRLENSLLNSRQALSHVKLVVTVISLCLLFGGCRIRLLAWDGAFNAPSVPTVRTAGIWPKNTLHVREQMLRHHLGLAVDQIAGPGNSYNANWEEIVKLSLEDYAETEKRVKVEADAGAKVVMLPELALVTFDHESFPEEISKQAFLKRMAACAKENGVFIGVGVGFNQPFVEFEISMFLREALKLEKMVGLESNNFLLFSPTEISGSEFNEVVNGQQLNSHVNLHYRKMNPVPVIEAPFALEGNSTIPVHDVFLNGLDSEPVSTSAAICFDMENPTHIRGTATSALVLNPSYDWPGLNPYHARVVAFRAIENGVNIFHHCLAGTSLAVDYLGNVIGHADFFSAGAKVGKKQCVPLVNAPCDSLNMVANMPTIGVTTLYSIVGDALAWLCVGVGVGLSIWRIVGLDVGSENSKRKKKF